MARKLAPSTAPVVLNAQHDPHAACVLTPVTAPLSRQSKLAGRRATSSSVAGAAAGTLSCTSRWASPPPAAAWRTPVKHASNCDPVPR
jgi:hypothetical protein